jgi:hypothetical protein
VPTLSGSTYPIGTRAPGLRRWALVVCGRPPGEAFTNPRYLNDKVKGGVHLRIKTPAVVDFRSLVAAEYRPTIG